MKLTAKEPAAIYCYLQPVDMCKAVDGLNIIATEHRAQSTEHRAQSTEHRAQSTEHRAQSTEHRAQSTEHRDDTQKTSIV
jgi:hypothetical protein